MIRGDNDLLRGLVEPLVRPLPGRPCRGPRAIAAATSKEADRRNYLWNHGIGETVTALIDHGLRLERLIEHDWTVWPSFPWLIENADGTWSPPPDTARVPLTFSLLASRTQRPAQPRRTGGADMGGRSADQG